MTVVHLEGRQDLKGNVKGNKRDGKNDLKGKRIRQMNFFVSDLIKIRILSMRT